MAEKIAAVNTVVSAKMRIARLEYRLCGVLRRFEGKIRCAIAAFNFGAESARAAPSALANAVGSADLRATRVAARCSQKRRSPGYARKYCFSCFEVIVNATQVECTRTPGLTTSVRELNCKIVMIWFTARCVRSFLRLLSERNSGVSGVEMFLAQDRAMELDGKSAPEARCGVLLCHSFAG